MNTNIIDSDTSLTEGFDCRFLSRARRSRRFGIKESSAGPITTTRRNRAG